MQWQFRKALQSIDNYKRIVSFKRSIQNGDQSVLDMAVRQIELILADNNEKIIVKVLALRFVRDIMLLGKEQIARKVQKLLPQLTKICSYELNSQDPDRGETYFHNHPTYIKLVDQQKKKQIDNLGLTYLILSLESVLHWSKWLPIDSLGQESIYSKAYRSLVERGVKFPDSFHYYKEQDSQKFKKMYQKQLFTDQYDELTSQAPSQAQKFIQVEEEKINTVRLDKNTFKKQKNQQKQSLQNAQDYTGEATRFKTVRQIMMYLQQLRNSKARKMGDLREIYKKVQEIYEENTQKLQLTKQQKRWIQTYIINFSLLMSSLIDYNQFLRRSGIEQIQLSFVQQERNVNQKSTKSNQMRISSKSPVQSNRTKSLKTEQKTQQLLKSLQLQYNKKIKSLQLSLSHQRNEIQGIIQNKKADQKRLIAQYQDRINSIKKQVKKNQQERSVIQRQLRIQNENFKSRINQLEEQLMNIHYNTSRERDIQTQRNQLLTRVKKLQLQNQKHIQQKLATSTLEKDKIALEDQLKQRGSNYQKLRIELKRVQKESKNYSQEVSIYKSQLNNERIKHEQKILNLTKAKQQLSKQNQHLKDKVLDLHKKLDTKQLQIINLKQEINAAHENIQNKNKRRQTLKVEQQQTQTLTEAKKQELRTNAKPKVVNSLSNQKSIFPLGSKTAQKMTQKLRFNNYQDIYINFRQVSRQMYIRFCRCCLKKKDILMKENELQVGVISELISESRIKFVLHFTNMSERYIQNLRIQSNIESPPASTLNYLIKSKQVYSINPQQQQKIDIQIANNQSPYIMQRAIIGINYEKNGIKYNKNILLPFTITKFLHFYKSRNWKIQEHPKNARETIQIKYNKKIISKGSNLKGYFQEIQQIQPNKYQVQAYHYQTDFSMQVSFIMFSEGDSMTIEVLVMQQKMSEKQRYIFQQLTSFLEAAFKK